MIRFEADQEWRCLAGHETLTDVDVAVRRGPRGLESADGAPYRPLIALDLGTCPRCFRECEWLPVNQIGKREPIGKLSKCCMATTVQNETRYAK